MSKNAKRQLKAIQEEQQGNAQSQYQVVLRELVSLGTTKGEGCLDDLVHDLKSSEASSINNSGVQEQVNYIVESCGLENAITKIKEVIE